MAKPSRILVLEDDDDLRKLLEQVLTEQGYDVTGVGQGAAAVELAGSEAFDLIIADVRMKGMDGLEAVERTQNLQPGIGSLIVSGYASEHDTARAERLDVGAYIKKPFKMQDLLSSIRKELAKCSRQDDRAESEDFQRQSFDWSLSTLCRVVDDSKMLEGSLSKAADLAEAVSRSLECDSDVCLVTRWATVLHALKQWPEVKIPEFFLQTNPSFPLLPTLLKELQSPNGALSRQAQIVKLSLQAEFSDSPDRIDEDEFEQEVAEACRRCRQESKSGSSLPLEVRLGLRANQRRSLVSVAHALERLGDETSALRAFKSLTADEFAVKERLEGYLGLARLSLQKGDEKAARDSAVTVLRLSKAHGPNAMARWGLEAALMLDRLGTKEAEEALQAVAQAALAVSNPTALALMRCALSRHQKQTLKAEHVKVLLSPAGADGLGRSVDWFFEFLFNRLTEDRDSVLAKVLAPVAVGYPSSFVRWFDPAQCGPQTRLAVSKVLSQASFLPERLARKLFEDPEPEIKELGNRLLSQSAEHSKPQLFRVSSFGAPEIQYGGEVIPETAWRTRKIKYLFYLLASQWGEPMNEDSVMDSLWGMGQTNKKKLYWTTSNLRNVLKSASGLEESYLIREGNLLSLDPKTPRWHDLEEFNRAFAEGVRKEGTGALEEALSHFRIASKLYTGPYLDGCYYEFAVEIKKTSEERAFEANLKASQICLNLQQDALALEHSSDAVEMAPHQQDARACKMRALIRLGQASRALDEFGSAERVLKQDYELEPSTELIELYHRARLGFTDA